MNINDDLDNFEPVARIVVIGVGGGGNNAINRMMDENITNVEFYAANTDKQALSLSKAPNRIILGEDITKGLGAGGDPEVGRKAAESSEAKLKEVLEGADLVFIAAGMGGGTGTGAAPFIAKLAKEAGALTVAIVTRPFAIEGNKKIAYSVEGISNLKQNVDSLIIVSNDKLLLTHGTLGAGEAFIQADKVLAQSVKTITDIILRPAVMNLDFADVRNVLQNSGIALIGFGTGEGENKVEDAAREALNCPIIEQSIKGAKKCICHITVGPQISLYDCLQTVQKIINDTVETPDLKLGLAINNELDDQIILSIIASNFEDELEMNPNYTDPVEQSNLVNSLFASVNKNPQKSDTIVAPEAKKDPFDNPSDDDIIPNFLKS